MAGLIHEGTFYEPFVLPHAIIGFSNSLKVSKNPFKNLKLFQLLKENTQQLPALFKQYTHLTRENVGKICLHTRMHTERNSDGPNNY